MFTLKIILQAMKIVVSLYSLMKKLIIPLFFKLLPLNHPLKFIITNLRFIFFFIIVKFISIIITDFDLVLLEESDGTTIKNGILYGELDDELISKKEEEDAEELKRLENHMFYCKVIMVISAIGLFCFIGLAFYYNTEGYREYLNQLAREEAFQAEAAKKAAKFEIALRNSEVIVGKEIKAMYADSWRSFARHEIIAQISDCHKNLVWSNVERHILTYAHACEDIFIVDGLLAPGTTYEEVLFHKMSCGEFTAARLNPLEYDSGLKQRDIWGWFMKEKEYLFPINKPCTCPPPKYFLT